MLQIIAALCIFFFIIVPIVNAVLTAQVSTDIRTAAQKEAALLQYRNSQEEKAYLVKRKTLEGYIRAPYVVPGIFGLFVLVAASSSTHVDQGSFFVLTLLGVLVLSIFFKYAAQGSLRELDNKHRGIHK